MGCFHTSLNRVQIEHQFNSKDILNLTQTWNVLKSHDILKFADDVLIRTINQNSGLRHFWTSHIIVEANNYDFSQGESCLRTDRSWYIGLRDHSIHFVSILNKLLLSINDENLLSTEIRSLSHLKTLPTLEHDSLMLMKQCIIETIHERFVMFKYDFTIDYERSWDKFLTFIIKHLLEKENAIRGPTQIIISPATNIDRPSNNTSNY